MFRNRNLVIAALVLSHSAIFFGGAIAGKWITTDWFFSETQAANVETALGHYAIYRDIALDIKSGEFLKAKCNADLGASAMFDDVKDCLLEENCKKRVLSLVLSRAPEVTGETATPFDYIQTRNGRKDCNSAP